MRAFLVAFVLALSVVAAGCGGSKSSETTPTEKWASGLCTSVNTWKSSITSTVSSVRQSGVSRDSLQKGVDQAKTATNKLTDDLRGLGRPNTEAGKEAQSQVDQFANELDDNIKKVEDAVGNTSGTQSALSALSVIGSTVSAMSQQLKSTITSLEGLGQGRKEIQQAFQTVPACKDLTASLT
jgi:chromosome segregation ATPase